MAAKWHSFNEHAMQLVNALLITVIAAGSAWAWTAIEDSNAFAWASSAFTEIIHRKDRDLSIRKPEVVVTDEAASPEALSLGASQEETEAGRKVFDASVAEYPEAPKELRSE